MLEANTVDQPAAVLLLTEGRQDRHGMAQQAVATVFALAGGPRDMPALQFAEAVIPVIDAIVDVDEEDDRG